jgi:hypothetical protein
VLVGPREAGRFDLVDRLTDMSGGPSGQRARFVLAMAAYGGTEAEIAAALDVPQSLLSDADREHIEIGRGAAMATLIDMLFRRAEAGNASAAIWLLRRMEKLSRSLERQADQGV